MANRRLHIRRNLYSCCVTTTYIKSRYSQKAKQIWKKSPTLFLRYGNFRNKWEIFSNFVAFSQYMDFTSSDSRHQKPLWTIPPASFSPIWDIQGLFGAKKGPFVSISNCSFLEKAFWKVETSSTLVLKT